MEKKGSIKVKINRSSNRPSNDHTYLYFPFEHIRQSVVPLKLLVPSGHGEHSWTNSLALPTHPDGHCWNPVHDVSSSVLLQPVKYDPGGTLTSAAPPPNPMALVPNGLHEIEPGDPCMYPFGHS